MIVPMTAETSTPAKDALDNITYAAQYNDLRISARECLKKTDLIARVILLDERKVLWFREHATKSKKVNDAKESSSCLHVCFRISLRLS